MRSPLLIGVLWVATVVLAWFLGAGSKEEGSHRQGRTTTIADERGGGREQPPAEVKRPEARDQPETTRKPAPAPDAPPEEPYTLEGVDSIDELSRRVMKFAEAKLKQGPEGHLALYREFDRLLQDREMQRRLVGDESQIVRLAYPWLRWLADHDRPILAMTETVYRTLAEDPAWFEETDDDTLEVFVEGLGTIMPGAVDEKTMARLRGYVEKVLSMDKESLPKAIRRRLRDLTRNLEHWSPPMAPEEMLTELRDPKTSLPVRIDLLGRIDPKQLSGVDAVSILSPAIEQGNNKAIQVLGRLTLSQGDLAVVDRSFVEAMAKGALSGWSASYYLNVTKRQKWAEAQPLIEEGLRRGGKATEGFALAVAFLRERPGAEYVKNLLATYELSEQTVKWLKDRCLNVK